MPPKLLCDALDVVLTWGPERMIPELERLREKQPDATEQELKEALEIGHQVLSYAEKLAGGIKANQVNGERKLLEKYPWVTKSQSSHVITQAMYYHWRETGF